MSASHKANIRRAWLAERIGTTRSDVKLISECAALFKVTEKTIREDLEWVYDRWSNIDTQMAKHHKARFMELGLEILQDARNAAADATTAATFAPVVAQFKALAVLAGVMREGIGGRDNLIPMSTQPADALVRERIDRLSRDIEIREKAMRLGLNLEI